MVGTNHTHLTSPWNVDCIIAGFSCCAIRIYTVLEVVIVLRMSKAVSVEDIEPQLLCAGILKASERWTRPVQNWNLTLSQLAIHFEGRVEKHIAL